MAGFEEILKAAGEFGRFQKCLVLLLCIPSFLISIHTFSQVFMGIPVPHHCNTSWIWKIGANLTKEQQLNLTLPRNRHGSYEECSMYTPVDWDIESIEKYGLNATEKCQDGWVYDTSEQKSTLITEFDLVCDKKEQEAISQSIFMLGLLIGALIFGPLGDRIGRRPIILLSLLLQLVFGVGAAFAPHFYVYVALRCVVGIGISGIMINNLVLVTEWVGVAQRAHATIISHIFFAIGLMVLAGLAYAIRSWRLLQLVGSLPVALVFFYIWIIPESARWLLTQGKNEKAKKLLQKAALINKQTIPEEMLQQLKEEKKIASGNILDLFRSQSLRKITLISSYLWFVNSLVYYGLSLNVGNFGLDIYLTQLVFGAVEILARAGAILILAKFGRKKCQAACLFLGGTACLVITMIPKDLPVLITVLAVIGKFSIASSFSISYVYAAELFPTVVRQNGVGLSSVSARLGGIIAPLIGLLGSYHYAIPMAIFGSTPVIAAALCFLLPETHNRELQDCTEEAAVIQRSNETVNGYFKKENTKQSEGDLAALQTKSTRL
ncbi:solute carrier family 22 member 13-like isoform X1 [Rhinatrema bivittatum]|uniref:solute carrier family 22 member 13-like isoform X1 n=1 Tax=Rhinatrema bivittatum TaxID=194408 RepID=UPI00112E279A|nr:solute carrier family 22 member 13-like isoform X1 [Rhinatrema bivittatum]